MGSAIVVAERLVISLDSVVNAGEHARTLNREGNLVLGRGNDDAILILNVHGEIREVGAACFMAVRSTSTVNLAAAPAVFTLLRPAQFSVETS